MSLVDTNWLYTNLNKEDLKILDCSWYLPNLGKSGNEEYLKERIPNSIYFDIDEFSDPNCPYPHTLLNDEKFSQKIGKLGIENSNHLIVYDAFGIFSSSRAWWMFKTYGHKNVSILNGGLKKWKQNNFPLEKGNPKSRVSTFYKSNLTKKNIINYDKVKKNISEKKFVLVDARPSGRFDGTSPEPRKEIKSGAIPNSVNIPYTDLVDQASGCYKKKDELKKIFSQHKIDENTNVVFSCGSGVTACLIGKAYEIVTGKEFKIFDGSWTEWAIREGLVKK
ncbi:MAG: sulfurtransferase [Candidatus Pelagibacter sp.]|nr:sulfurtransferase [Candidatus Pelagibacter sp.]OUV98495.1 MAG: sulfurtransferase [Candidatus Pelagibacter sp. TMED142]|tara:strand:+ start:399 stop:1232 length:834 start_codon:yes stop_codon:yes gene_type:complete